MARPRNFDPTTALEDAMELFWGQGYESTSLDDLVDHTGVARWGLYSAFGSKRQLYLRALEHYIEQRNTAAEELLRRSPGGVAGVRALLGRYADDALGEDRRGCLVVNSAIALGGEDEEVAAAIRRSWKRIAAAISFALSMAQEAGDIPADRDVDALADMVVVTLQGLRVLARVGPDRRMVRHSVDQTVQALS